MNIGFSQLERLESRRLYSFDPSPAEQEMIELINRMRTAPAAELSKLVSSLAPLSSADPDISNALSFFRVNGTRLQEQWATLTPVAPLAWNEALSRSASVHNDLMIAFDTQSHNLPGEPNLIDRIRAQGYGDIGVFGGSFAPAESVYAFGTNVFQSHAAYAIDWGGSPLDIDGDGIQDPPGHRNAMMRADFREVGINLRDESSLETDVGPLLSTIHFGAWTDNAQPEVDDPYLVGVAYDDLDNDGAYDAGEGLPGVTVRIVGPGVSHVTTSMSAGGWQQRISAPGDYIVTFEGGALLAPISYTRTIGTDNVKLDVTAFRAATGYIAHGADGWLYVRGTDFPDSVTFDILDDDLVVTRSGETQSFPVGSVMGLQTNLYAGADFVSVSPVITLPTRLYTGQDNDTILGGAGDDYIVARLGDDVVYGNGGNDTLMTGQGNDFLGGGPGNDSLFGGQGNDTMYGGQGDDIINSRDHIFADLLVGGLDTDSAKIDHDLDVYSDVEILLA